MSLKHFISALTCLLISACITAQITTRQVAAPAAAPGPVCDSTETEITVANYKKFVGQVMYVRPESKLNANGDYRGFLNSPDGRVNSKYSGTVAGKYFKITGVVNKSVTSEEKFEFGDMGLYLKLEDQQTHSELYYRAVKFKDRVCEIRDAPFIIVGFIDKLKQQSVNKTFVAQKDITSVHDINNGKLVACAEKSEWACTDVTFIDIKGDFYPVPVCVLKDAAGNEIAAGVAGYDMLSGIDVKMSDFRNKDEIMAEQKKQAEEAKKDAADKKKAAAQYAAQAQKNAALSAEAKKAKREAMIKKYGEKNGALIAEGQISVGMTAQMCIDAWGKPQDINKTTATYGVHEQWVYNMKSMLYFEDGILKTIQN